MKLDSMLILRLKDLRKKINKSDDSINLKEFVCSSLALDDSQDPLVLEPGFLELKLEFELQKKGEKGPQFGNLAYFLGVSHFYGFCTERNLSSAQQFFRLGAKQEHAACLTMMGVFHQYYLKDQDLPKAISYYLAAIKQEDAFAMVELGNCYEVGIGVEKDVMKAVAYYQMAASHNNALAEFCLGQCYSEGIGVKQDLEMASKMFWYSASQGYDRAGICLGICYQKGLGIEKSYEKAVFIYRNYGGQNPSAQFHLGYCYEEGLGDAPNFEKAVMFYASAANKGNAMAQNNLGLCYEQGRGVKPNPKFAALLYLTAAEQGNSDAQLNIGKCYEHGIGVEKDINQAIKFYSQAANSGNKAAKEDLAELLANVGQVVFEDAIFKRKYENQPGKVLVLCNPRKQMLECIKGFFISYQPSQVSFALGNRDASLIARHVFEWAEEDRGDYKM